MCTTKQTLSPERWTDFFGGLATVAGSSLVAVEVVRKQASEQCTGRQRTLAQIGYDSERDVLTLTVGALDGRDGRTLRLFIHAPQTISVEDRVSRGALLIVVCDASGVRTRIRLHARQRTRIRANLRRAGCGEVGRARRGLGRSQRVTAIDNASARRPCRARTSA